MPRKDEDTSESEIPTQKPPTASEENKEDEDKVMFVDLVTYLSKRKKKVEKIAVKAAEIEDMLKKRQADTVQLSLFG